MKRVTLWFLMAFCMLTLACCGKGETEDGEKEEYGTSAGAGTPEGIEAPEGNAEVLEEIVLTGEYVPVAEFAKAPFINFYVAYQYIYKDGEIICQSEDGDKLLAYAADGTGMSRVLAEADCGENSRIIAFFIDREDNLYLYEYVFLAPGEFAYYLRKIDKGGREAYRVSIGQEADWHSSLTVLYVDREGNVALIDRVYWEVCFFDSEGQYQGKDTVPYEGGAMGAHTPRIHYGKNDLICIGGQYFLWDVNEIDASISLWEVDFGNCCISEERVADMSSFGDGEYQAAHRGRLIAFDGVLFDGGELGLLVSTEDVFWQYDMETGMSTELLRWDERLIGIDGRCVRQVDVGEEGEGGIALEVMVYNTSRDSYTYATPEVANITYVDRAYIKESRVVSIGLSSTSGGIEQTIRRFNRLNNGYEVVLVDYDAAMLKDMLSFGKEIPDLLDITNIRAGWLENKNLLEDLAPYFERSGTVNKEDILPGVWELLEGADGKLTSMATGFTIRALSTAADLPEDGWTYSQLLSLEEQYPGIQYMSQHTPTWVWALISMTGVDEFVDWQTRKCSFDSEEFYDLIERVKDLDYPANQRLAIATDTLELVMSGRVLMQYSNYGSPYDYEHEQEESGGGLKTISFPTMGGEPTYIFTASQSLAIYGESPNKDGAWAFLEFLLDEEQQRWYGANRDIFPVNVDAFEEYLARPNNIRGYADAAAASEETQEKLRYMASHLALNQNAADEISSIINEELKAYFAGDKTVKQTAKTIQNRVQLYLDEM